MSPAGSAFSSPCPIKTPCITTTTITTTRRKERCIPDSGLFLGASFRVGWASNGVFCSQAGKGSASAMALKRMVVGSGVVADADTEERQAVLRKRVKDLLRVHYDHSLPENNNNTTNKSGAAAAAPRWQLQCSREGGALRDLTQRFIVLCNEQAAVVRSKIIY